MKIFLKNIGVFKQAEYELGDLTIICGENNTGKTYATYSLFGFFDFWQKGYEIAIADSQISELIEKGSLTIAINRNIDELNKIVKEACRQYSQYLPRIIAANEKYFESSDFEILLSELDVTILDEYKKKWSTARNEMFQVSKELGKDELSVSLLVDSKEMNSFSTRLNITNVISLALKEIIFKNTFGDIFIASAERTGAVIFRKELNEEQHIILKEVAKNSDLNLDEILNKAYKSSYALPVKKNIEFIKNLEEVAKGESFISKQHTDVLDDFADIIGGEYKVSKEGLYYSPKTDKKKRLTMIESSSSVRSLLDIGFYLRYSAEKGDLLIIDEPELNLHPANQRKLAKLFARLISIGIKVFITTHSDYIIKEINTLVMLNHKKETDSAKAIMRKFKYNEHELVDVSRIKVFISEINKVKLDGNSKSSNIQTLVPAVVDEYYGIEARSFDRTIEEMNAIQESIILGRK